VTFPGGLETGHKTRGAVAGARALAAAQRQAGAREERLAKGKQDHTGASADAAPPDPWDDKAVLSQLTVTRCAAYVGEPFHVVFDDGTRVALELIAATPYIGQETEEASAGRGRIPFSLVFRGPRTGILPQRTYRIAHAALGEFPLFLVPIGPDSAGMRYEAAFM
jgi:hypothetical protein